MKITPKKYGQLLASMLETADDVKKVAPKFLAMLRRRKQYKLLPKILKAFEREWLKLRGMAEVKITYPKKFESSLDELKKRLQEKLGGKLSFKSYPADELIGGVKIMMDDNLIDASVSGRLRALQNKLSQ